MDFKIVKQGNYTDLNGKQHFRYKIFYYGRGFWISSSEFANYPDYINVQGDIITLKEPIEQFFAVKIKENKNGKFNVLIPKSIKLLTHDNQELVNSTDIIFEKELPELNVDLSSLAQAFRKPTKEEIDEINALMHKHSENSEENVIKEPEVLYQFSENEIKISPLSLVFKTEKTVRPQTKIAKEKNVRQQLPKKVKSTDKTSKVLEKKDKTSNKLSFVNNLLDYSIKKKVDEKTRERIFTLIGKEVENSDELKEVIARIEKLENELKPANQESVEEKFELDLSTHKPLNLVNFIFKFKQSDGIKYLTHNFDKPGQIFKREEILEIARKEYGDFVKQNPISWNFNNNFNAFAFGEGRYRGRWYFNGKQYTLNWMAPEIINWCKENSGRHPLDKFSNELIHPFQITYKIEGDNLITYIKDKLAKALGNSFGNYNIEYINCEEANFQTDVDSLLSGISGIFNSIKQREKNSKKIKIVFERKGRLKFITIIHVGSKSNKSFEEEEKDIIGGDLNEVKKNLYRVCDWSIISENPSNNCNQVNILYDIKQKNAKEIVNKPIEGFTHILTFYS